MIGIIYNIENFYFLANTSFVIALLLIHCSFDDNIFLQNTRLIACDMGSLARRVTWRKYKRKKENYIVLSWHGIALAICH